MRLEVVTLVPSDTVLLATIQAAARKSANSISTNGVATDSLFHRGRFPCRAATSKGPLRLAGATGPSRVRIFGAVMNDMVIVDEGRVAMIAITRHRMAELNGTNDDLEGLINFPLTVKDIEAVAFFKEIGDQAWRVSLRSKGSVDIGAIARRFKGGGHTNAAGCSTTGDLDAVHKQFGALLADAVSKK
jgi:nanoRNase/pAp phosphatase (c-di-AMP/oligoRNAs hydrolase)